MNKVTVYAADVSRLPDPKEYPQWLEKMPQDRTEKILRYAKADDRRESLGAGLLLQYVLLRHGVPLSRQNISFGAHSKPQVEGLCFNLSHSHGMAVCAVSDRPVGCDIEKLRQAPLKVARRFFSPAETAYLDQFADGGKDREFFRLWTMKEAYMKMTGEGFHLPMKDFEIRIAEPDQDLCVMRNGQPEDCAMKEYQIPGWQVAVCAKLMTDGDAAAGKVDFAERVEMVSLARS